MYQTITRRNNLLSDEKGNRKEYKKTISKGRSMKHVYYEDDREKNVYRTISNRKNMLEDSD